MARLLTRLPQLGLVAHLGLAFLAVATLAIAANIIAEHGTLVVHTTDVVPVEKPVVVPPPPVVAPVVQPQTASPPPATLAEAGRLSAAIHGFGRTTLNRVNEPTAAWAEQLKSANGELSEAIVAYVRAASGVAERRRLQQLTTQVSVHELQASELVQLADSRGKQLEALSKQFEELDAQTKSSLDRAWKIFGRVVTRQSVLDLGRRVDDLRRNLSALATLGSYRDADIATISASEAAFADALERASPGAGRSQAPEWLTRMRIDLDQLVFSRQALLHTDEKLFKALADFPAANAQLDRSGRIHRDASARGRQADRLEGRGARKGHATCRARAAGNHGGGAGNCAGVRAGGAAQPGGSVAERTPFAIEIAHGLDQRRSAAASCCCVRQHFRAHRRAGAPADACNAQGCRRRGQRARAQRRHQGAGCARRIVQPDGRARGIGAPR